MLILSRILGQQEQKARVERYQIKIQTNHENIQNLDHEPKFYFLYKHLLYSIPISWLY